MIVGEPDSKPIPTRAIIVDGISNLVGAYVTGLSKRTQYYAFIDTAKGNRLQQPYQVWFAKQVLEPLEKTEKNAIRDCLVQTEDTQIPRAGLAVPNSDRLYRGILVDDEEKVALAESRLARCKGWFEETHRETEIFRAYFILDRIRQQHDIPSDKLENIPAVLLLTRQEFGKIYLAYDEQLLKTSNLVEDRLQTTLATLLSSPIYWLYYGLDGLLYLILGVAAQYPDLTPRSGFSLRLLPLIIALLSGFRQGTARLPLINNVKLVGLGPLAERQAVKIAAWLTNNSFSKIKDIVTENSQSILNNVVAIALGAVLSATIVTRFYPPTTPAIDPAFLEAVKAAKFDLFTFKNGDLGIVTYEMPQIPERMRYGEVCRVPWRDVNRSLQRYQSGNIMDLADLRCQEGFLADPLKAFYDERSQAFAERLVDTETSITLEDKTPEIQTETPSLPNQETIINQQQHPISAEPEERNIVDPVL